MGDKFLDLLGSIFTIAAGVAIVALIVSKNSNTSAVVQSWFSGNSNLLAVAETPVTGSSVSINTSYPAAAMGATPFGDTSGSASYPNL